MTSALGGLQGVWVDLLTPLNDDLSISHKKLSTHVRTLGAKGIQGVVMFGHAGEGLSFSAAERLEAVKQLMAHGVAGKDILLHAGFESMTDAIQLIRAAHPLGLQGCILTPPLSDGDSSDQGLIDYFHFIARGVSEIRPRLFLSSLSSQAPTDLRPKVITEVLGQHPGVFHGLIDQHRNASNTVDWIRSFMALVPVLSTNDMNAHAVSTLGIHAGISGYANLIPALMAKMVFASSAAKVSVSGNTIDTDDERLAAFARLLEHLPEIPALKFMLAALYRDNDWLRVRPPLSVLRQDTQAQLAKEFKKFMQSSEAS